MTTRPPKQWAHDWLAQFARSLAADAPAACAALFHDPCFWRDLLAFTWNIVTLEGRDAITAMLHATLARTRPSNWVLDGEPTDTEGTVEA